MYKGWILDVYPNYEFDTMNVWLWTCEGAQLITDMYKPFFYVYGQLSDLRICMKRLEDETGIASLTFKKRRLRLESEKLYEVLEVGLNSFSRLSKLPPLINRWGGYSKFQLFDVDLRLAQKYMFDKGIFPMAFVKVGRTYRIHDDVYSMHYEVPPLRTAELAISVSGGRAFGRAGAGIRHINHDEPLSAVHLTTSEEGPLVLESTGDESELMMELVERIRELDVDIIYTSNGDEVIFPYLYHRASLNGMGKRFMLDRAAGPGTDNKNNRGRADIDNGDGYDEVLPEFSGSTLHRPEHGGKSYFTYGRIAYKPPYYSLKGRLHIDRRSSFIHRESGLDGIVEISRMAGIPLQTMSRLSPGSAISAMQVGSAMRDGILIKWKKNSPEQFKSATDLLTADRGGHIFDPCAGIHDNVFELDFTSLYPSIIARKNISPETVLCPCCSDVAKATRVPGLNYHICTRKRGLIPKVVAPIIARRIAYKSRGCASCDARQKVLKWVLVTCFGYTGYRNARFGRIECHESITAFARDILLESMEIAESMGYSVLHGFVDSLWLKTSDERRTDGSKDGGSAAEPADISEVARKISRRIGVPLELEGRYKWIVFLPNKSVDVGALTRYYGLFEDGTLKVRGIELRQHSTPEYFIEFQKEILEELSKASNVSELQGRLPAVVTLFNRYADEILSGGCDARKLIFNARVTRTLEEYRVFNNQLAALMQLNDEGIEVHPGESISYMIKNSYTHDPVKRVSLADRVREGDSYDRRKYLEFLCRFGDSMLRPFGLTEDVLAEHASKTRQTALEKYGKV